MLEVDQTATTELVGNNFSALRVVMREWSTTEGPLGMATGIVFQDNHWHRVSRGVDGTITSSATSEAESCRLADIFVEAVTVMARLQGGDQMASSTAALELLHITSNDMVDRDHLHESFVRHDKWRASVLSSDVGCCRLELRRSGKVWCLRCNLSKCAHARMWPKRAQDSSKTARPLVFNFDSSIGTVGDWSSNEGTTYISTFAPDLYPGASTSDGVLLWVSAAEGIVLSADLHVAKFRETGRPINISALFSQHGQPLRAMCDCESPVETDLPVFLMARTGAAVVLLPTCRTCGTLFGGDSERLGRRACVDELADIYVGALNPRRFAVGVSLTDARGYVHGFISTGETISNQYEQCQRSESVPRSKMAHTILAEHLGISPEIVFNGKKLPS